MCNTPFVQERSTLVHLLRARTAQSPNNAGYHFRDFRDDAITGTTHLSYAQLDFKARLIGAHLQALRVTGKRALLIFPAGLDYVAAFFGCLYAGVVAVPVYPPHRNRSDLRLQAILKDAEPSIVLAPAEMCDDRDALAAHNPELGRMFWLATDTLDETAISFWREPHSNSATLAFLQYTSGSTGTPKGVMLSHGNLMHNLVQIYNGFGHTADSKGVIWLPPFHDMGLIGGILQPLYVGSDITLMSPISFLQKPVRWLQAVSETRATTSGGPNFAYDLCVRKITPEQCVGLDLSSWDVAFCGAEPVREETLNRFAEAFAPHGFRREAFFPCYGLAEATLLVSGGPKMQPLQVQRIQGQALMHNQIIEQSDDASLSPFGHQSLVSCGLLGVDQTVEIVHPETRTRCAPDEVGEIWVQGKNVAHGYWNRADETAQTFGARLAGTGEGPFMRTGDLGFVKDGCLCITGRLKDLIIIRGLNHYPQDIEATVAQCHSALHGSFNAAFSIDIDGNSEEHLVIVSEPDRMQLRKLNMDDVVAAVRGAVSTRHAVQVHALCVLRPGGLPKTTSGKVQRRAAKAAYQEGVLNSVSTWHIDDIDAAPATLVAAATPMPKPAFTPDAAAIQKWMASWLATKMKLPATSIDPNKPFAEYGLDSLTAVEMAQALTDWLQPAKELKPTLAWDYPTLAALAAYLAHAQKHTHVHAQPTPISPVIVKDASADDASDVSLALQRELAQIESLLQI